MQGTIRLCAVALAGLVPPFLFAGDIETRPATVRSPARASVPSLLAGLDSSDYVTRRSSTDQIQAWLDSAGSETVKAISKVAPSELSFEALQRLERLGLAEAHRAVPSSDPISAGEIGLLVAQLGSDRYLERSQALTRLQVLVHNAADAVELYRALKEVDADTAHSTDVRVLLSPLLELSRYRRLTNPSTEKSAGISIDEINGLITRLSAPLAKPDAASPSRSVQRRSAERELLDGLAQSASASAVQTAIAAALDRPALDPDATARLRRLAEWARPAVAVEHWQRRQNVSIQLHAIGVASQTPGAMQPTRFDAISETEVHCESGNLVKPGEYPLGVAYPHPREQAAFLHFVSLPTARERLVYQYELRSLDEQKRLQAITERTLAETIASHRALDDAQLWLLGQLDQPTVARLMSNYFRQSPDELFDLSQLAPMLSDVSSVHRTACLMLALDASPEVVPALVDAAQSGKFIKLAGDEPHAMPWIAALTIASREPWDGVDDWLAQQIHRTDRISFGQGTHASLGATAAALLLSRYGERPEAFALSPRRRLERGLHEPFRAPIDADYRRRMFEDRMFKQLDLTPYSFATADAVNAVARWWQSQHRLTSPLPPGTLAPATSFVAGSLQP